LELLGQTVTLAHRRSSWNYRQLIGWMGVTGFDWDEGKAQDATTGAFAARGFAAEAVPMTARSLRGASQQDWSLGARSGAGTAGHTGVLIEAWLAEAVARQRR
jgi:hypothetical protein